MYYLFTSGLCQQRRRMVTPRRVLVTMWLLASLVLGLHLYQYGLNFKLAIAAVISWLFLSIVAVCAFFSHAATIGGPEHRDPTEAEIKAAKEKYSNPYLDRSGKG